MRAERKNRLLRLLSDHVCPVRRDVVLARYTSFRIGGPADIFVEPHSLAELQAVVGLVRAEGLPLFVLGGGSNLLVSDAGIRGVVVKLGKGFNYSRWSESGADRTERRVRVGAGRSLGSLCPRSRGQGLCRGDVCRGHPRQVWAAGC